VIVFVAAWLLECHGALDIIAASTLGLQLQLSVNTLKVELYRTTATATTTAFLLLLVLIPSSCKVPCRYFRTFFSDYYLHLSVPVFIGIIMAHC